MVNEMTGALDGIKVLDFTHYGVGPWGASLLAQMGADVLKIEPPEGDHISRSPPPYKNGITTTYIACNLNKRICILDPRTERDRQVIYKLVETADVIVENRRPGYMERRGIDYNAVSKVNPRIVYCSSSGYGYRGPLKEQGSTDGYGSTISGFASVSGPVGGPMEGLKGGGAHIDFTTSVYIASGILAALYKREITGKGQWVQTSQMQAAMALSGPRAQEYFVSGQNPRPMGSGVDNIAPSRAYRASDGKFVNLSAPTPEAWKRLCQVLGLQHLLEDPRFVDNAARVQHRDALDHLVQQVISQRPAQEWVDTLQGQRVPSGLFLIHNQVRIHPQVKSLEMLRWIDTPWGELRVAAPPWQFSETPAFTKSPPRVGANTEEVIKSAGF